MMESPAEDELIAPDRFVTSRLLLRPIALADSGPIFDTYARDTEVARFMTWRPHQSREDTDTYIVHCLETAPEIARTYVMTGREDGAVRGAFELRRAGPNRLEVGYVLARRWWGLGLMTEALTEVARWALRQDCVFRIGSVCDVENIGSARVMEKSGLVREGLLRRWLVHPNISDEPRDCFVYAMVR
jgi:[ribosomal protein S5]-alanine N-acetyltransferase